MTFDKIMKSMYESDIIRYLSLTLTVLVFKSVIHLHLLHHSLVSYCDGVYLYNCCLLAASGFALTGNFLYFTS